MPEPSFSLVLRGQSGLHRNVRRPIKLQQSFPHLPHPSPPLQQISCLLFSPFPHSFIPRVIFQTSSIWVRIFHHSVTLSTYQNHLNLLSLSSSPPSHSAAQQSATRLEVLSFLSALLVTVTRRRRWWWWWGFGGLQSAVLLHIVLLFHYFLPFAGHFSLLSPLVSQKFFALSPSPFNLINSAVN